MSDSSREQLPTSDLGEHPESVDGARSKHHDVRDETAPDLHFPVVGICDSEGSLERGRRGALQVSSDQEKGSARDLRGSGLVLVVDDDSMILQTTKAILQRNGYEVLTASDGRLALEAIEANKDRILAVILDLTMPEMGGEETLLHIEKIAPSLPVILSSGYDAAETLSRFGQDRLAGSLQKPASVSELLETVKTVTQRNRQ